MVGVEGWGKGGGRGVGGGGWGPQFPIRNYTRAEVMRRQMGASIIGSSLDQESLISHCCDSGSRFFNPNNKKGVWCVFVC